MMNSKIVADNELLAKVRGVTTPTTVFDESGNAVLVLMTPGHYKDLLVTRSATRFQPQLAEQAWQDYLQNGGCSTSEALLALQNLDDMADAKT